MVDFSLFLLSLLFNCPLVPIQARCGPFILGIVLLSDVLLFLSSAAELIRSQFSNLRFHAQLATDMMSP